MAYGLVKEINKFYIHFRKTYNSPIK
jgi:hypothetical protein